VDYYEKIMPIEDKQYLIKVWDTAGQEKFAVMAKNYYKRAHGMIVVCAINDRNSYENIRTWLSSIKENAEDDIQIILIANKSDLEEEREVLTEDLRAKAEEHKIEFFETSSKENTNVNEAFDKIIHKIYNTAYSKPEGIDLKNGRSFFLGRCCGY
jgi:small GTP-binding protein